MLAYPRAASFRRRNTSVSFSPPSPIKQTKKKTKLITVGEFIIRHSRYFNERMIALAGMFAYKAPWWWRLRAVKQPCYFGRDASVVVILHTSECNSCDAGTGQWGIKCYSHAKGMQLNKQHTADHGTSSRDRTDSSVKTAVLQIILSNPPPARINSHNSFPFCIVLNSVAPKADSTAFEINSLIN